MKRTLYYSLLVSVLAAGFSSARAYTLNYNSPYPLYSANYPWTFLDNTVKERHRNEDIPESKETTQFSITPFGQRTSTGSDLSQNNITNLGDFRGPWDMIGLLYGTVPTGKTQPSTLATAAAQTYQDGRTLGYANYKDIGKQLGFFSIPLEYRKVGCRLEWQFAFAEQFLLSVQAGFADIKQTAGTFADQSSKASTITNIYGDNTLITSLNPDILTVQQYLMDPSANIFTQLGYDVRSFNKTGAEDVFVGLTWRNNISVNKERKKEQWASFIITPFVTLKGCFGVGKQKKQNELFGLPFGNDGHHGIELATGFGIDFSETIEISVRASGTHFFKRSIANMYVPTSTAQSGIFPYATDVVREPGKIWAFNVGFNSHHFIDKLSVYAEYFYLQHSKDCITLKTADAAYTPSVLEDLTPFNVQGVNIGFLYDLSPYLSCGGVWQLPVSQRNAYQTNTIALSVMLTL